jgi:hypothetical protein
MKERNESMMRTENLPASRVAGQTCPLKREGFALRGCAPPRRASLMRRMLSFCRGLGRPKIVLAFARAYAKFRTVLFLASKCVYAPLASLGFTTTTQKGEQK